MLKGLCAACCGVPGPGENCTRASPRGMLAVGGGGMLVRLGGLPPVAPCRDFFPRLPLPPDASPPSSSPDAFFALEDLGSAPPYFCRSSRVESYFVASLSFWIVFARSFCWSFRRALRESVRKLKYRAKTARTRYMLEKRELCQQQ